MILSSVIHILNQDGEISNLCCSQAYSSETEFVEKQFMFPKCLIPHSYLMSSFKVETFVCDSMVSMFILSVLLSTSSCYAGDCGY